MRHSFFIHPYVDDLIQFAKEHKQSTFLVTRIGCGIAGFRDEDIAPLSKEAEDVTNIILPKDPDNRAVANMD